MAICDACFARLNVCPICRAVYGTGDDGDDDEEYNAIYQLLDLSDSIPARGRVAYLGLIRCLITDYFTSRGIVF
jgi:hypothetical protein